jgi:hypothetical protein
LLGSIVEKPAGASGDSKLMRRSAMQRFLTVVTVLLSAGAILMLASGQTMANPAMAQKTGKACNACHTTPPALNAAGKKYKAGGK